MSNDNAHDPIELFQGLCFKVQIVNQLRVDASQYLQ